MSDRVVRRQLICQSKIMIGSPVCQVCCSGVACMQVSSEGIKLGPMIPIFPLKVEIHIFISIQQ